MTRTVWLRAGAAGFAAAALLAGCAGAPSNAALVGSWGSTAVGKPNLTIENDGSFRDHLSRRDLVPIDSGLSGGKRTEPYSRSRLRRVPIVSASLAVLSSR
jgi:hypothetical protein